MATISSDETIRVAASQVRALSNVHPGFWGAVKENYANAEGYASDNTNPYCDSYLINEESSRLAYIFFRSHSSVTFTNASHVFDLGHLQDAVDMKHRKFNVGTYIVAGKMCRVGKEGMTVISFDPVRCEGLAMRAYISEDGYVCKVNPCLITLDKDGHPSLFASAKDATERNRIEKLWLGTQWENGEFNQGASHKDYCSMLWSTCVEHAMGGGKPSKMFATTVFLYCDLKAVVLECKTAEECFLKSIEGDILERDGGSPAYGFRNTIREHFMPYVNRMPLQGVEVKKRQFFVGGKAVTLNATGSEDAPWCSKMAKCINDAPKSGQEWYKLLSGHVSVKFSNLAGINADRAVANFKHYSRAILGANQALPVGAVVVHGDKIISKTPFGMHKGECFQLVPEAAQLWEPLANALLNEGRVLPTHVDKLWALMGIPDAKRELDPDVTAAQRAEALGENARALGVDGSGTKGYKWLCQLLIKPFRKARTKVDVEGVKKSTGVFKIADYIDDKAVEINYMSKQAVKDARAAGELDSDVNYANRMGYMAILGLTTAAVVQVGHCEQPMDKERLLDDAKSKQLHKEFFRCLIHHVLSFPTPEVTAVRDAFLAKWAEVEADGAQEENNVEWVYAELRRRLQEAEKKKREQLAASARKAAEAEKKRQEAEAKAAEAERRAAVAAAAAKSSTRPLNVQEEALKDREVQKQLAIAARAEKRAAAKEARIREQRDEDARAKAEAARIKKEENKHKADLRHQRTQAAQSHFSSAVAQHTDSWSFPEQLVVKATNVAPEGDIYPRSRQTKDVARFNDLHSAVEAACYAFDIASLKPGNTPRVAAWVRNDPSIAISILESLMAAENVPHALRLDFNYGSVAKMATRTRVATAVNAAQAVNTLTTPPAARQRGRDDSPPAAGQPPLKKQRGSHNHEAGGSGTHDGSIDPLLVEELDEHSVANSPLPVAYGELLVEGEEEEDDVEDAPSTDDEEKEVQVDAVKADEADEAESSIAEI